MPFSRDPRKDRRRRVLRETIPIEDETAPTMGTRARARRGSKLDDEDDSENLPRRSAGYSQDVRRTCQHRMVQLIPVRRRAFIATIFVSFLVPTVLLTLHYLIYVSGTLRLYGNPLAILLDAGHARSLCSWLCSQLWLLCLAATILTFRLRRHKLDDYQGEYRLWFWLVSTCIVGSLDSTTGVTEIFGQSLDRWSQANLGWSGRAVVQATLATLIGILGLRLCSELKNVPTSLVFWLLGLVAWAASATLSQELFKIDLSSQFRYWLRSASWIGGMTSIWVASLAYLRSVYIDAQRRFLLRGHLAASVSTTWTQRVSAAMPAMPAMPKLPMLRTNNEVEPAKQKTQTVDVTTQKKRFALPSLFSKKTGAGVDASTAGKGSQGKSSVATGVEQPQSRTQAASPPPPRRPDASEAASTPATKVAPAPQTPAASVKGASTVGDAEAKAARRSWLGRFLPTRRNKEASSERSGVEKSAAKAKPAPKSGATQDASSVEQRKAAKPPSTKSDASAEGDTPVKKRRWLPQVRMPKPRLPKVKRLKLPKFSLPKLKLPSLRLPPPAATGADAKGEPSSGLKPVSGGKPLPGTNGPAADSIESNSRSLSKAERKRLKKGQDDQENQRHAA
jgi:hypothetical protein